MKKNPKTERIYFRVTPEQKAKYIRYAEMHGITLSELIIALLENIQILEYSENIQKNMIYH